MSKKYCYFFDSSTFSNVIKYLKEKNITPAEAKQNPCEVLKDEIGFAAPSVWQVICKHDALPWYEKSKNAGKYLLLSSFILPDKFSDCLETTFEPVDFSPLHIPSEEELKELAEDTDYLSKEPAKWKDFPQTMGAQIANGIGNITNNKSITWNSLFITWTANHSNFVNPRFRAGDDFSKAPYSIADSYRISSCCAELFNLIESEEKLLLVRPCTGALMLNVLEKDRYYMVRIMKNNPKELLGS